MQHQGLEELYTKCLSQRRMMRFGRLTSPIFSLIKKMRRSLDNSVHSKLKPMYQRRLLKNVPRGYTLKHRVRREGK